MGISFSLSRDQLKSVLNMVAPFTSEENIRLTLNPTQGVIVTEIEELGVTGKLSLGTTSIAGLSEDGLKFFVTKSSLNKIHSVSPEQVGFNVKDDLSEVAVNIGGDLINLGLPIFEKEISTDYEAIKKEAILSEHLLDMLKRATCSDVKASVPRNTMEIGGNITFASMASVSVVSGGFKDMCEYVSPRFAKFIESICRFGQSVTMSSTDAGEVVFTCDNVEYKTPSSKETLKSPETVIGGKTLQAKVSRQALEIVCQRLSIPLSIDNNVTISKSPDKDNEILLEVVDIQGRRSFSKIQAPAGVIGDSTLAIKLPNLQQALAVMDDDIELLFRSSLDDDSENIVLQLNDSKQSTYLIAEID